MPRPKAMDLTAIVPKRWRREDVQQRAEDEGFTRTIMPDGQPMISKKVDQQPSPFDAAPRPRARVIGPEPTPEEMARIKLRKKPVQIASVRG